VSTVKRRKNERAQISCMTNYGTLYKKKKVSNCTSVGRGAPKVENPTLPGANVTLPGRLIPWIPHRPA